MFSTGCLHEVGMTLFCEYFTMMSVIERGLYLGSRLFFSQTVVVCERRTPRVDESVGDVDFCWNGSCYRPPARRSMFNLLREFGVRFNGGLGKKLCWCL